MLDSSNGSAAAAPAAPAAAAAASTPVYSEPTLLDGFEDGNKALDKLKELGIGGALFEHQAAMTVQEQLKALGSVAGVRTKNLFLKVRDEEKELLRQAPPSAMGACRTTTVHTPFVFAGSRCIEG